MSPVLVSGLINLETTVQVDGFPIDYSPVRYPFFGVRSSVSGVGYNVAKALTVLGTPVRFLSLIGQDLAGAQVAAALAQEGIPREDVLAVLEQTAQSVILYDRSGRRQINVDLKDIQERGYPAERFDRAAPGCALAVLCNINFSRPLLARAQQHRIPIATDVHAISDLEDDYNRDFMQAAQVLFMSDERLPCSPEDWARRLWDRFGTPTAVIGLGAQGALLAVREDRRLLRLPAVATRPVVSTIGAGDALFSCFVHAWTRGADPVTALRRAMVFASYKIGAASAAEGFLSDAALDALCREVSPHDA